jgi:hypothetical protein
MVFGKEAMNSANALKVLQSTSTGPNNKQG